MAWFHSDVTHARLEALIKRGLLCARTPVTEWLMPGHEAVPTPPDGYVISFMRFHERSVATPCHHFFRGLLHHYKIKLQHLNPNGIQHIATFITLCEGFLGIKPHFKLWKYFFVGSL